MKKKPVDFTYIRYANCWEDADLLLANTTPSPNATIASIASAGDNSLAFLASDPALVIAFDINPAQLYLTELKQMAIKHFAYDDVLSFLGIHPSGQRTEMWQYIEPHLSNNAQQYFRKNSHLIENGIIHQGKFERYFQLFRTCVLPLIHSKETVDSLFCIRTASEQKEFYEKRWSNRRWRWLFRFFFSQSILGRYGRDPQFFDQATQPVSSTLFARAERHLQSTGVSDNFYLEYQLRGHFSVNLPFYLRPENFENIKRNIDRLQLFEGALTDMPTDQKFDILNLSNIFEYMDDDQFGMQADFLPKICKPDAKIAYWNLLVNRSLPEKDSRFLDRSVKGVDRCFFYQSFHLNTLAV